MARVLTPRGEDFPRWYQEVVAKAKLADNGPVRGTMVIRPNGYAIWEGVQQALDVRMKQAGAANAYFPVFIPYSYLQREADHVEGFSPELAVVTQAGGKELDEPVVVRPTSETVINASFSRWIESYRDLPLLVNQWSNVVRWELRPRLFLRTSEFLWQEGHTAHATEVEASDYAIRIARGVYQETMRDQMALPVVLGLKSEQETFAGAVRTHTLEAMTGDGKALQVATSHELGQNFAKAFDTTYLSAQGTREYVWQTSWGASTRLMGALIMGHGDDAGLRLPPALAPDQVVVMVVRGGAGVGETAARLIKELTDAGLRARLDDDTATSFGRRVTDVELRGVPLRVDVGPRELADGRVALSRRDTGEQTPVPVAEAVVTCTGLVDTIQSDMLDSAADHRDRRVWDVSTLAEAREAAEEGWARVPWPSVQDAEADGTLGRGLSVRCLQRPDGSLPRSTDERDLVA